MGGISGVSQSFSPWAMAISSAVMLLSKRLSETFRVPSGMPEGQVVAILSRKVGMESVDFETYIQVRDRRRNADRFKIKARLENVPDGTP